MQLFVSISILFSNFKRPRIYSSKWGGEVIPRVGSLWAGPLSFMWSSHPHHIPSGVPFQWLFPEYIDPFKELSSSAVIRNFDKWGQRVGKRVKKWGKRMLRIESSLPVLVAFHSNSSWTPVLSWCYLPHSVGSGLEIGNDILG